MTIFVEAKLQKWKGGLDAMKEEWAAAAALYNAWTA